MMTDNLNFVTVYKETSTLNILFVEDDVNFQKETLEVFSQLFKNVSVANNGKEALDIYNQHYDTTNTYFDLVISDINMPLLNGVELTKELYKINQDQLIIILSAHNESEYLIELINLGIKQFLMKPLEIEKLLALFFNTAKEINDTKQLNSSNNLEQNSILSLSDDYKWDKESKTLSKNGTFIKLTNYETSILQHLIENSPRIIASEEILNCVWKDKQFDVHENVVKSTIHRIRQKTPGLFLENISKLGYRLIF